MRRKRSANLLSLLAARLDKAMSLRDDEIPGGGAPVLITSGGQGAEEPVAEADAMADYLVARGVPEDMILRETLSTTTSENLCYSRAIMAEHAADPPLRGGHERLPRSETRSCRVEPV